MDLILVSLVIFTFDAAFAAPSGEPPARKIPPVSRPADTELSSGMGDSNPGRQIAQAMQQIAPDRFVRHRFSELRTFYSTVRTRTSSPNR